MTSLPAAVDGLTIENPEAAAEALVVALSEAADDSARRALAGLGELQPGAAKLWMLRLASAPRDPKAAWSRVLERCPDARWAAPVLRDAGGNELLPTGTIAVRFRGRPSDRALEAFAEREGMRLERRNEFVPEQAIFRPRNPREVYLPELVSSLAERPEVTAAWAATTSRYRRD